MKNALNYYYNLITNDIHQIDKTYSFSVNNEPYLFILSERQPNEINSLYEISTNLFKQNIYTHQIIPNNNRELITMINNEPYILLKLYINSDTKITFDDLILYNYFISNNHTKTLNKNNWRDLWMQKMDYYEEQIREFGVKYPLMRESFSYFIGLTETGIMLLQGFKDDSQLVISHKRINSNTTLFDLYNPLNFIIDSKSRNICEYIKSMFFNDKISAEQIKQYLQYAGFNSSELYLFFVRLFYPSFYFDIYDDIIYNQKKEKELLHIIAKIPDYERLIKELYLYLKNYITLPEIEWIIKI
ncbi:MAG: hypothetical protein PHO63_03410 [Bacilli bacterium]|nr:hypothetical protein [Bacilli bacterium]MDD4808881.1 hypothetical protein [Bacilli bacterium]